MAFQNAREWKQVTFMDYGPKGLMRKVSQDMVDKAILREWDEA